MHYPYIAFCINLKGELVVSHQRDPTRSDPLEVPIPLSDLQSKGYEGAAQAIGQLTLSRLGNGIRIFLQVILI
jgi:hypothetical protein